MVESFLKRVEEGIANLRNPGRQAVQPIDIIPQAPQAATGTQTTEILETIGIPGGRVIITRDGEGNIRKKIVPSVIAFGSRTSEEGENP